MVDESRTLDRAAMETGLAMNMLVPIQLIQAVIDGMADRGFGRIVNITSVTVKMPVAGLQRRVQQLRLVLVLNYGGIADRPPGQAEQRGGVGEAADHDDVGGSVPAGRGFELVGQLGGA